VAELAPYGTPTVSYQNLSPSVPQLQRPTTPSGTEQRQPPYSPLANRIEPTSISTGADVLSFFDSLQGNWSGRGQHVEFIRNEPIPLKEGTSLGRGASADVHEVFCRDVRIARKQIYYGRRMKIEEVKSELDILKKLSHRHVVTLVGSYTQNKILGILLYPAAVCDLGVFLDELDEAQRSQSIESCFGLLDRLGITHEFGIIDARTRLRRTYGCITTAVQYLHDNNIRHKDLKPRNILLDRDNGLFITDFGISRDNTDASTSVTNGIERGTYKYCAPEIARLEPRGRAADIYALGCVFLEINTVYRGLSLVEFDTFRTEDGDYSFQNSPAKLQEWMRRLRAIPDNDSPDSGVFDVLDIINSMLSEFPNNRPVIASVSASLKVLGRSFWRYFGECCDEERYLTEFEKLG
jgi:serine/threonine protein kinase